MILDLTACHDEGCFTGLAEQAAAACAGAGAQRLMALGAGAPGASCAGR